MQRLKKTIKIVVPLALAAGILWWMYRGIKWEELTAKIGKEWDALIDLKHIITDQIRRLPDERHIKLLGMRYVDYKSFEQIAVELGYSFEYTLKLHGRALMAFTEMYKHVL